MLNIAVSQVKPNNGPALYVIMTLTGMLAAPLLPVALELAVEMTRNADCSSAILWFAYVTLPILLILL